MEYDVVIVGAGVVGLACAQRLARTGRSVLVLERHGTFGQETSSRHSEVISTPACTHRDRQPQEARLCVAGNRALYGWCALHNVRHQRIGKYIIATSAEEETQLEMIFARARANGVDAISMVPGVDVRRMEPRVLATAALWSPNTGIVDSHGFMSSLMQVAREHGCDLAWKHSLLSALNPATGCGSRGRTAKSYPSPQSMW